MKEQALTAALWAALEEDLAALWDAPEGEMPDWSPDYAAWEADFLSPRPARRKRRWGRVVLAAAAAVAVLAVCTAAATHIYLMNGGQQWFVEVGNPDYEETGELPLYEPSWLPDGAEKNGGHLLPGPGGP